MSNTTKSLIGTFVLDVFYVDMETQEIVHVGEIIPTRFDDKNFPITSYHKEGRCVDTSLIFDALRNKPSGQMVLFKKDRSIGMLHLLYALGICFFHEEPMLPIVRGYTNRYFLDNDLENYGFYVGRHRAYLDLVTAWKQRHAQEIPLGQVVTAHMYKDTIVPAFAWRKPS